MITEFVNDLLHDHPDLLEVLDLDRADIECAVIREVLRKIPGLRDGAFKCEAPEEYLARLDRLERVCTVSLQHWGRA